MITLIPGDAPPPMATPSPSNVSPISPVRASTPLVEIVPSPARVQPIPHHGFKIEDTVTLHDRGMPADTPDGEESFEG